MSLGKYRLIHTPSNQALCDEYENKIQYFINDKEDNFWSDDFYPAWKDDRIGGMRIAMGKRQQYQEMFIQNTFEQFKKARLAELDALLESENSISDKREMRNEKYHLEQSNSYSEFGKKMGFIDSYFHSIFPNNPDNNEDKKQIIWTHEKTNPIIDGRYEMMQSIAFQMVQGNNLPKITPQTEYFRQQITNGVQYYKDHKNDGAYATKDGREHWIDNLSFQYIRTYAHQANGYTETLNDALYAITSSPEWPYICKYFENKANKEQKYQEAACWEQGTIEYLRQLAVKKNVSINNIISSGIDFKNIKSLVQPALYDLNKAEQLYTYISNCVNEYNTYKKEHPQEIENLKPSKKDYVSLNPHAYLDMISQTSGTLRSLSNRMVSDHQAIYTTYEVGKQALIDSSFFIPGYGLAIGGGLWVANISTIEEQDKMIKYIADKVDFSWATEIKNSHVIEEGYRIVKDAQKSIKKNKNRLKSISDEDFRHAVTWAWKNGDVNTGALMDIINEAQEWPTFSEKEKQELKDFWEGERQRAIQLKKENPEDPEITEIEQEYSRFVMCCRAAETGNYFTHAYVGSEVEKALKGDSRFVAIKKNAQKFNTTEQKMLEDVETALSAQFATEYEANMRTELVLKWRQAGRPIVNEENNTASKAELPQPEKQTTNATLSHSAEKNLTQQETVDNNSYNQYNSQKHTK